MTGTTEPIVLGIGILILYVALACAVVFIGLAFRLRSGVAVGGLVGAVIGAIIIAAWLPGPIALRMLITGLLISGGEIVLYQIFLKHKMQWHDFKAARIYGRQTTLHLALLTLSFIFLVPFAWLLVTSLKEESEMSKFPPVWIPTQQVEVTIDGEKHKLATTNYQTAPVQVAIMHEYDTGKRLIRIVKPDTLVGKELTVSKGDLKPIRRFAPVWKNYPDALKFLPPETHYGLTFLANTLQISVLGIFGTLLSSSMVAYGFARLRWPGRDTLFMVLLATMMLPSAVTMMPVFLIFRWLGWVDTLKPLWVPAFFGSAFYIFLLRQFFMGIPTELEDAAKIDGCSYYMIFWRIMLPQIKPALAALTIMAFMAAWNDFRGPLIYISSAEKEPLAYALQLFQSAHGSEPGMLMAASTLVMLPVLGLFFFTQRYFIQGITLTGIKG